MNDTLREFDVYEAQGDKGQEKPKTLGLTSLLLNMNQEVHTYTPEVLDAINKAHQGDTTYTKARLVRYWEDHFVYELTCMKGWTEYRHRYILIRA